MSANTPESSVAMPRRAPAESNRRVTVRVPGFARGACSDGDPAGWLTASFVLDARRPRHIERGGELRQLVVADDEDLLIVGFRTACASAGARVPETMRCRAASTIPIGAGCGASAVAVVAGIIGARALLDLPLDDTTVTALACRVDPSIAQVNAAIDGHTVTTHLTCDDD